jgi:dihydroorotate dehydrogenase electron transfer subunit
MLQLKAEVVRNKRVKGNRVRCLLAASLLARQAEPGQFVNIKVTDSDQPLLRRPLSIHRANGKTIEVLYEIVGKATEILSHKKQGEYLDIIGPLGNGFNYKLKVMPCSMRDKDRITKIIVAGGMGVAPLLFLAEKLVVGLRSSAVGKNIVLLGARTGSQIICEKEFIDLGYSVKIATDDGSKGFKGKVTELLKNFLEVTEGRQQAIVYACGPRLMLREISRMSNQYRFYSEVSLEEHMACGIGACLGCVVNTTGGYKRVCKEGPVFNADEIIW